MSKKAKIGFKTADTLGEKVGKLSTKVKDAASSAFGAIKKFITGHPLLTAAAALGAALGVVTIIATKTMKTVTEEDKKAIDTANKLRESEQKYQETLKNRRNAFDSDKSDYLAYERAADQLDEMIDSNGKLKVGYEKQFEAITKCLDGVVTLKIAEDGRIKILNDENELIDYQNDALDKIIRKKRQQAQLDSAEVEYKKALEQDSDLAVAYDKAKKAYESYRDEIASGYSDSSFMSRFNDYTKGAIMDKYKAYMDALGRGMSKREAAVAGGIIGSDEANGNLFSDDMLDRILSQFMNEASSLVGHYGLLRDTLDQASVTWAKNRSYVSAYEEALKAVASGAEDADEKLSMLSRNVLLSGDASSMNYSAKVAAYYGDLSDAISEYGAVLSAYGDRLSEEEKTKYRTMIDTIMKEAKAVGLDLAPEIYSSGLYIWDSYYSGFASGMEASKEDIKDKSVSLFGYLSAGLAQGMSESDLAKHMYEFVTGNVIEPAYKATKTESPSKVFAELGNYLMLGLIKGVEDETSDVEKAFNAVAAASVAAYNSAMNAGNSFAWTPLIDTTGIQNGTALLQSQMAGLQNTPLATTMTSKLAASVDTSSLDMDNSRILESMAYISEELGALKDVIANLQVVMDSGQLVGALAPGMDMELGRRTVRKERGV